MMRTKMTCAMAVAWFLFQAGYTLAAAPPYKGGSFDGFDKLSATNLAVPQSVFAVLGTNGAVVADGEAVSAEKGTSFGAWVTNSVVTNWFAITNSGAAGFRISATNLTGAGASQFSVGGAPSGVAAGTASNFWIAFAPTAVGLQTALVSFVNSSTTTPYRVGCVSGK